MLGSKWVMSAAMLMAASTANAAIVDVTFQVPDQSFGLQNLQQSVTISTPNDPAFGEGGLYDGSAGAGQFQLNGGETLGDFIAYCVELSQSLQSGQAYSMSNNLFSGRVKSNIARLFSVAQDQVTTSETAAAFQVALWEIVHDDAASFDLTGGNVRISDNIAVTDQADLFLQGLSAAATDQYEIIFLSHPTSQDIVLGRLRTEGVDDLLPVPAPATGLLLLGGIGGLAALRRRRRAV